MIKNKATTQHAFTLVEVLLTIIIVIIPILVVGIILADSHRSWNTMYNHINSDVAKDTYVAVNTFDAVVRRASGVDGVFLDDAGDWVEVYYYQDGDSAVVDRYAFFYVASGDLLIEYGQMNPKTELFTRTICENVSDCVFKQAGQSLQMILTLDDGTQTNSVVTSAIMHN